MRTLFAGLCAGLLATGPTLAQPATPAPGAAAAPGRASLEGFRPAGVSGRLLLTGGVTMFEGASGGGLTPWATIGGYGTRDQIGATAFGTFIPTSDFRVSSAGALVGLYNRLELSYARSSFDTQRLGGDLGLGNNFRFDQDIFGAKLRLFGDVVLGPAWLPQVSAGVLYRQNDRGTLVRALGAERSSDLDYYVSATRLFLDQSVLVNGTLRLTRANDFGFLGSGGPRGDAYQVMPEFSVAYLINRNTAIGAEYRRRPRNLDVTREHDAFDLFVAYAPTRNVSITLGYVDLGRIVTDRQQRGAYISVTVGF